MDLNRTEEHRKMQISELAGPARGFLILAFRAVEHSSEILPWRHVVLFAGNAAG